MRDNWDTQDNHTNTVGYLTLYKSKYEDLFDFTYKFDWKYMDETLVELNNYMKEKIDETGGNDVTDEYNLIGINSDSFQLEPKHHSFLEWDEKKYVPEMHILEKIDGMIIESGRGIHVIKENNLHITELIYQMSSLNCCEGFRDNSYRKKHATLRVSPKANNGQLKIIKNKEGFLYSVYRELIENLSNSI